MSKKGGAKTLQDAISAAFGHLQHRYLANETPNPMHSFAWDANNVKEEKQSKIEFNGLLRPAMGHREEMLCSPVV